MSRIHFSGNAGGISSDPLVHHPLTLILEMKEHVVGGGRKYLIKR
jgi:hypothetical protein